MTYEGVRNYGITGEQELDGGNTQTVTAAVITATDPWVGSWSRTRSLGIVRMLVVLAATDTTEDGLGGTFTFEFSEDGVTNNGISEVRTITDFQTVRDFDLINAGEYFRIKFSPSRALSSDSVFITTTFRKQNDGAFVRIANQQIEKGNAAMSQTFSYAKGFALDGRSADFPLGGLDPDNSSQANLTNTTVGNFTVNASTDVVTLTAHGLSDGTDLVLSTTDTLPAGLAVDTQYFVISSDTNTFKLSATSGGSAIDITDTGTGTHTAKEPGTYTGTYRQTSGFATMLPFAFGLQKLSVARVSWSTNGTTQRSGLLATSALTHTTITGFEVYLTTNTTLVDKYARIEIVNGSDDQTNGSFEIATWFYDKSFSGSFGNLDAALSTLSTALLTRAVVAGVRPNNTFANVRLDGRAADADFAEILTEVALANDATYTSAWFSTIGWRGLRLIIVTDQQSAIDGIKIDFTDDATATSPTTQFTVSRTFSAVDVTNGFKVIQIPADMFGARIRLINGGVTQGSLFLVAHNLVSPNDPPAHNDDLGRSLTVAVGHRTSQVFGRTKVRITSLAIAASAEIYSVPAGQTLYITAIDVASVNTANGTPGHFRVREVDVNGSVLFSGYIEEASAATDRVNNIQNTYQQDGKKVSTAVYYEEVAGTVESDVIIEGYLELT